MVFLDKRNMLTDNRSSENTPARKLFAERLSNKPEGCETPEILAYHACLQSMRRIQDKYCIDLNQLNNLNPVKSEQCVWEWEVVDLREEYVPSFYHPRCYRSDGALNSHTKETVSNSTVNHSIKCYEEWNIVELKLTEKERRNTSLLSNEIKHTGCKSHACTLFTLWKPKIQRGKSVVSNKNQATVSLQPLKRDPGMFDGLDRRSQSLDNYPRNLLGVSATDCPDKNKPVDCIVVMISNWLMLRKVNTSWGMIPCVK
uniref:Uncharacterized protein n=1 Tax=Trichobilharzia regenti TaxID=157069 RepID=A0AA85JP88_TRIRE|nr:unnamed protein product [Trichobilharzia regenti]CAH8822136.1 unnamed protein product [Trichobilharzia regenti]